MLLREVHGFSTAEAADALDATAIQVKNWIQRARRTMTERYQHTCALVTKAGVCHQCVELDQFFNAAVDSGIVLATFLAACDAVGLGTCPISVIRDHSQKVSDMLGLPQRVIPTAGMCVGWPSETGHISPRLGLEATLHNGGYNDSDLAGKIDAYDRRRAAIHPYKPRDPARWGEVAFYGWSEDKARQYGVPQRPDFGAFVRRKGFKLD